MSDALRDFVAWVDNSNGNDRSRLLTIYEAAQQELKTHHLPPALGLSVTCFACGQARPWARWQRGVALCARCARSPGAPDEQRRLLADLAEIVARLQTRTDASAALKTEALEMIGELHREATPLGVAQWMLDILDHRIRFTQREQADARARLVAAGAPEPNEDRFCNGLRAARTAIAAHLGLEMSDALRRADRLAAEDPAVDLRDAAWCLALLGEGSEVTEAVLTRLLNTLADPERMDWLRAQRRIGALQRAATTGGADV